MSKLITIGTLHGSDLRLHWSWPVLPPGVAAYSLAVFPWREAVLYVLLLLAAYICVLARQGVQLLAARRFRLGMRDVTLYPFWGVPRLTWLSDRPWQENYIAATGPVTLALIAAATGGGLAAAGYSVTFPGDGVEPGPVPFLVYLFWATVLLAALHCLPLLPLDGGRIFRASLALSVSRLRATEAAAAVSTLGAVVLLVAAVVWFRSPLLGVTAVLIYLGAQEDLGTARYFAGIRHAPDELTQAPAAMVPMDHIVSPDCRPDEPHFNGFTWNAHARLWIEWRDGQPVSANALIGDGRP
ncbi:MAG TPA: site-2 protease family protein [Gemmataceae bacterium]|nr:site-2 protease family protein [Gemmataceae bacterium]